MPKKKTKVQKFIARRMRTFAKGKMHSRKKTGHVVKSRRQAIAISLSEARKKGLKVKRRKK